MNRDSRITREEWEVTAAVAAWGENALLAIRAGGAGDITESHVAWKQTRGLPYVPSPLYYRGRIYLVKDGGLVWCYDAGSGRVVYQQERLGASGNYYASPVAADGRIYMASINGVVTVLATGDVCRVLAQKDFKDRPAVTPALAENRLYLRTDKHLYAFGEP